MSIASIKKREAAATAGPWGYSADGSLVSAESIDGDVAEVFPLRISLTDDDILDHDQKKRNAEFIAHAREDVPLLLEAVEALQSVFWMAERWAEGGGSKGPEQRDIDAVKKVLAELQRAP